jgi:hypothetical protein
MRLRFFKRFRLAPGLYVNLSPRGPSLTARLFQGLTLTAGRRGLTSTITPVPGTGASASFDHRLSRVLVQVILGCAWVALALLFLL